MDCGYWFPWHWGLWLLISLTLRTGYWFPWHRELWVLISLTPWTVAIDFLDTMDWGYWFPWHQGLWLLISLILRTVVIDFLGIKDYSYWFPWHWGLWLLVSLTPRTVGTDFQDMYVLTMCIDALVSLTAAHTDYWYWCSLLVDIYLLGPGRWCFALQEPSCPIIPQQGHCWHCCSGWCTPCTGKVSTVLSVCLSTCLHVCLPVCLSVCKRACLCNSSVCLSASVVQVCLSRSVCLLVYLSVYRHSLSVPV